MAQLTEIGRKKVQVLILLSLGATGLMAMFVVLGWYLPYIYLLTAAIPLSYYGIRHSNLNYKIKQQTLTAAGFFEDIEGSINFADYAISKRGKGDVTLDYIGHLHGSKLRLVNFSITTGSGKNKTIHEFTGAEFTTTQDNLPVQVYDNSSPLKPWFGQHKLESNEFHEKFSVFAGENKNVFYQLDPDTMHDLIALRDELGAPVNIEFLNRKVLVYTSTETYKKAFKGKLSFAEVMNGEASAESIKQYRDALNHILEICWKIFQTLDLTIEKTLR